MWAQNVSALTGYHSAASAAAAQIVPWQDALGEAGARIGRVVDVDRAMINAQGAANAAEIGDAARFTRGALDAAAVEARLGRPGGAVRRVASAVAYDAQAAAHILTEDAALPARLLRADVDILAAPWNTPPATAPVSTPAPAADLAAVPSEIARADAATVARVLSDNQVQLSRAAAVTESGLRAAETAFLGGDPVAAARDVAQVVAHDADIVGRLGVEDLSLPGELIREDIEILRA